MTYSAIDGDISDFFDFMVVLTQEFRTDELITYLQNGGHEPTAATLAFEMWKDRGLVRVSLETFTLTAPGVAFVENLRVV